MSAKRQPNLCEHEPAAGQAARPGRRVPLVAGILLLSAGLTHCVRPPLNGELASPPQASTPPASVTEQPAAPPTATADPHEAFRLALAERCRTAQATSSQGLDDFKLGVSCHLYQRNAAHLFDGAPPPMLKSVVVLSLKIDAAGRPGQIQVLRSNGHRNLNDRAIRSIREAAPLPAPPRALLRGGHVELIETWLFNDDDRFQLRSLAATQARGDTD